MFKDSWKVMDSSGNQIGTISEDSGLLALVRRFVPGSFLFPKICTFNGGKFIEFTQKMNPFVHKMNVTKIQSSGIDPRVVLAATMLLIAIEGRQGAG
ncbi:MAG: hypothetical protein Ct9H90mP23_2350 [Methanobacteriota archaeon]|nr:MAG: hypothetical protein Ct9H90mP23_2350 [Euryarchaeota archaeon]